MRIRNIVIGLILLVAAGIPPGAALAQSPGGDGALADMDSFFRTEYADARSALLAATDPIVICAFDDLVLFHNGTETRATFTPPVYHEVKAVSHLPLALYVMLARYADRPVDAAMIEQLATLRAKAAASEAEFSGLAGWDEALKENNRDIVASSLALIDKVTAARTVSGEELTAYARATRPAILYNVEVAARAQIDGLAELLGQWRAELGADAWNRARVVVLTTRQAREGNLQYAYFRHVMGAEAEDVRLFEAENIGDVDGAMRLLGTILLDRGAGVAFFDSTTRLERDLLANAAASYIDTLSAGPSGEAAPAGK